MDKIKDVDILIQPYSIGWISLTIQNKTSRISYLNDFIENMRELLNFGEGKNYNPCEIHRCYFDNEGRDLYLNAWKSLHDLFITWEHYNESDDLDIQTFRFNYDDFMKIFNEEFDRVKDLYYEIFDLDSLDRKNEKEEF